ncbi:MAG: hypothetical protein FJX60_00320 [Alphaproteobacteria bacterium]|nr:hypothetical protein [Alphaproteobacteria bacterium]
MRLTAAIVCLAISPAFAADDGALAQLRRPGVPPREVPADTPVVVDPTAVPPPSRDLRYEMAPVPDRWRLVNTIGVLDDPWNPYRQSTLKGDRPIYKDYFFSFSAILDTVYEPRSFPVPVGLQSTGNPGDNDAFGRTPSNVLSGNLILSAAIIKGDTAFKPPDFELRFTPVFNRNRVEVDEPRLLYPDPSRGTRRTDQFVGLQDAFLDYHLRNVSDRYDFDSIRVGIQPFISDFRGFLFQDNQLGVRLFGSRSNNQWQYNAAWFRRLEKDTNSGLNDAWHQTRSDDVVAVNLYRQDFPVLGFTSQATVMHNRNREGADGFHYDKNGFLQRPAPIGFERPRDYDVTYFGLNGDGHFGRLNLTASAYYAHGKDKNNPFTDETADIRAYFAAAEPSIDFDWFRLRLAGAYASADKNPFDRKETGFDAIFENPQFAGADASYWIRQAIPLIGGGGLALSGRNGMLASLRTSKEEGQSNFNNPGLALLGGGADLDILPELRFSVNANRLWFADTKVLDTLRMQEGISRDIGWDLSAAFVYRPFQTQNVVLRLSGAVLLPGKGFKELFDSFEGNKTYYSVLTNIVLTY